MKLMMENESFINQMKRIHGTIFYKHAYGMRLSQVVDISITMNTVGEKFNGLKGNIASILYFVGGLVLYLAYHYGLLFIAGYPSESLSSIIVIGLVPVLAIAAIFNTFLFRKTGNVYVAAFLNTILMTMIKLANTALYPVL
ncbi:hypothetical protein [Virgibacillus sp. DJP39]|uniref:hypothetical protein n=1 Tax=Virgibacillus sp. DJP39 TaxID=3409790 RepID=UPI003BB64E97